MSESISDIVLATIIVTLFAVPLLGIVIGTAVGIIAGIGYVIWNHWREPD